MYVTQYFRGLGVPLNCDIYITDQPTIKAVGPWQKRLDTSGTHEFQIWSKFVWKVRTNGHAPSTTKCCSDRYAYALRQRQRVSVAFRLSPSCEIRYEQCTADRHDSSVSERNPGTGTWSTVSHLLVRLFLNAVLLFLPYSLQRHLNSRFFIPRFASTAIAAGVSSRPLYAFFVKSAVTCVRAHDLVPKLYDEYQWNALRKGYIATPIEFRCHL
jgi:hypothetical protein